MHQATCFNISCEPLTRKYESYLVHILFCYQVKPVSIQSVFRGQTLFMVRNYLGRIDFRRFYFKYSSSDVTVGTVGLT